MNEQRVIRSILCTIVMTAVSTAGVALAGPQKGKKSKPKIPSTEVQIKQAVQAAPADRRDNATVFAFSPKGELMQVRSGTNDLTCIADDPDRKGFQVACYHKDLEPYMARGRSLRAEGLKGHANLEARWKEIDDGKLTMPKQPRTLYVLSGDSFDAKKEKVKKAYLRWVIYTPYATPESTGLSTQPSPGAPWIMFPGTAGAHIMIMPPKKK